MPGSADGPDGTYDFYAYYLITRSSYMSTNQIGPSSDVQNDSSVWMILEYKHLKIPLSSKPTCDGTDGFAGGQKHRPRYVADYVAPSNHPTDNPYEMFTYNIPDATDVDQRRSIEINLRFKRNNGNRVETLPTDGGLLSTKIFPRNVSYW